MEVTTLEGTRLGGRYSVGPLLGRGGMSEVYDAVDERLGRQVAVKVLRPDLARNDDVRRRFESEARSAARLSHPNVVTIHDTGEDDGVPFIIMERLPGETVADRIAAGRLDEQWVRRVAGDVLQALTAAHGAGVIHRDVKPGNILIGADGCAKVADFGIAKSAEIMDAANQTATNLVLGTPAYLAPERLEGRPATFASDIYSLGVVLYEALAGRKPFGTGTPIVVAQAIRDGAAPPLRDVRPDVDPTLAGAVDRAMALDPTRRFASAAEMQAALDADVTIVTEAPPVEPTLAMPLPLAELEPEPEQRRRRVLPAVVAGLFAVLLLVAVALGVTASGGGGGAPASTTTTSTLPPTTVATVAPVTSPTEPPTTEAPKKHKGHGKKDE